MKMEPDFCVARSIYLPLILPTSWQSQREPVVEVLPAQTYRFGHPQGIAIDLMPLEMQLLLHVQSSGSGHRFVLGIETVHDPDQARLDIFEVRIERCLEDKVVICQFIEVDRLLHHRLVRLESGVMLLLMRVSGDALISQQVYLTLSGWV